MAPLEPDKYLRKLRELRQKHAWESTTSPQLSSRFNLGEAYAYVLGFQAGLDQAEKLVHEILTALEKDFSE